MGTTMTSKSLYNILNLMKLLLLINSLLFTIAKSEIIAVGGDNRWADGFSYVSWAETLNFTVGDVLVFSYTRGSHNVLDVTRATFQSCNNSTGVNAMYNSGDDHVKLNEAKTYWFICTVRNHCRLGMRFGINVSEAAATFLNRTSNSSLVNPSSANKQINVGYLLAVGILSMLVIIV